jgi:hypothetical protein
MHLSLSTVFVDLYWCSVLPRQCTYKFGRPLVRGQYPFLYMTDMARDGAIPRHKGLIGLGLARLGSHDKVEAIFVIKIPIDGLVIRGRRHGPLAQLLDAFFNPFFVTHNQSLSDGFGSQTRHVDGIVFNGARRESVPSKGTRSRSRQRLACNDIVQVIRSSSRRRIAQSTRLNHYAFVTHVARHGTMSVHMHGVDVTATLASPSGTVWSHIGARCMYSGIKITGKGIPIVVNVQNLTVILTVRVRR